MITNRSLKTELERFPPCVVGWFADGWNVQGYRKTIPALKLLAWRRNDNVRHFNAGVWPLWFSDFLFHACGIPQSPIKHYMMALSSIPDRRITRPKEVGSNINGTTVKKWRNSSFSIRHITYTLIACLLYFGIFLELWCLFLFFLGLCFQKLTLFAPIFSSFAILRYKHWLMMYMSHPSIIVFLTQSVELTDACLESTNRGHSDVELGTQTIYK